MSTVERATGIPLVAGLRTTRSEFHEAYEAMPPGFWAELIGGVVYVSSPVKNLHAIVTANAVGWLFYYKSRTPGLMVGDNGSTVLDDDNEVQPDAMICILPDRGGQTTITNGLIHGAPELVIEVAWSSRAIDLGVKKVEYEKARAREYLVFAIGPDEVFWHVLEADRLVRIEPDADGIYRSKVFPGLWLDPFALYADDGPAMVATLERGLASEEHARFVAELNARKKP